MNNKLDWIKNNKSLDRFSRKNKLNNNNKVKANLKSQMLRYQLWYGHKITNDEAADLGDVSKQEARSLLSGTSKNSIGYKSLAEKINGKILEERKHSK